MKRVKEGEAGIRVWVDIEVAPDKWKAWADASIQMLDRAGLQRAQATWRAAEAVAYQRGEVSDSDIIQGQEDELLREGLHLPRSLYLRDKPVLKLEWTEWRLRSRTAPVPVARNAFGGISDVAIQLDGEARLGDRDVRGASYIIAIQPAFDSQAVLYRLPTGLPPQVLGEVPAEVRESRGADRSYFFGPRRLRVLLRAFDKAGKEVALGARPFEHDLSGSDIGISPIPAVFRLGVGVARTAASSPMFQTRWGLLLPLLTKEMVPGFVVGSAGAAYPIDLVLPISIATEIDRFEPELYLSETTK
jgi:hypothetical protein